MPLVIEFEGNVLQQLYYKVVAFGLCNAEELFNQGRVELYTLLPTMDGANTELLVRAIDEMVKFYAEQRDRLSNHLLWFGTFLGRTEVVTEKDKEEVKKKMEKFASLLDENSFVKQRVAETRAETRTEVLQQALVTVVRGRFPALTEFAQQQVVKITKPDVLDYLIERVSIAPDEAAVRLLLSPRAA